MPHSWPTTSTSAGVISRRHSAATATKATSAPLLARRSASRGLHDGGLGNHAAARGWLDRARRTLDRVGPCVEWGYLDLALMGCDRPDVDILEASADRALAIALEFGDHDLEVLALADGGLALITQGRIREGFDRLDSAMAAIAAGEVADFGLVGQSFCPMLTGCDRAGDVNRVEEWVRVIRGTMLEPTGGQPKVLATHCLLVYGSVVAATGQWSEADQLLTDALGPTASRSHGHRVEITCNLACLRVHQGRLEEAAALLAPYEDEVAACEPTALVANVVGRARAGGGRGASRSQGDEGRRHTRRGTARRELLRLRLRSATPDQRQKRPRASTSSPPAPRADRSLQRRLSPVDGSLQPTATTSRRSPTSRPRVRPAQSGRSSPDKRAWLAEQRAKARTTPVRSMRHGRPLLCSTGSAQFPTGTKPPPSCASSARTPRVRSAEAHSRAIADLSARELEVLDLARQGNTNAEIAARLYISPKTAEHHVSRILNKLGVRTRAEAAALAATATRPQ